MTRLVGYIRGTGHRVWHAAIEEGDRVQPVCYRAGPSRQWRQLVSQIPRTARLCCYCTRELVERERAPRTVIWVPRLSRSRDRDDPTRSRAWRVPISARVLPFRRRA